MKSAKIMSISGVKVLLACQPQKALESGKNVHVGYLASLSGPIMPAVKLPTLQVGFERFTKGLDELLAKGEHDLIILGYEPTGIYHEAWGANLIMRYGLQKSGPNVKQSGNHKRLGKISYRGSPYLRQTLFQIGHLTTLHCPDCTRVYHQAKQLGMNNIKAIIHVANKANRIMFSLLRSPEMYSSPLSEKEAQKWQEMAKKRRSKKKK